MVFHLFIRIIIKLTSKKHDTKNRNTIQVKPEKHNRIDDLCLEEPGGVLSPDVMRPYKLR